jgi:hypothetical protein
MAVVKGPGGVPVFDDLPDLEEILSIKPTDADRVKKLYAYLRAAGMESPIARMNNNRKHLAGFGLVPDSPGYQLAMDRLADAGSGETATVALARRVATKTDTLRQVDGKPQAEFVRIADGDDPCPACLELDGTTGTYAWFVANDLEPPAQCYGSSNCMCIMQKFS